MTKHRTRARITYWDLCIGRHNARISEYHPPLQAFNRVWYLASINGVKHRTKFATRAKAKQFIERKLNLG